MGWIQFARSPHSFFNEDEVRQALRRAGLNLLSTEDDMPSGPGVIFFSRVDDLLYKELRGLNRMGRRVLAVAGSRHVIAEGVSWTLLQAGAADIVCWEQPDNAAQIAARLERWEAIEKIIASPVVADNLVGRSAAWQTVLRQCVELGRFTGASVLIMGETGTGKELAARLIHTLDPRPGKGDLIVVDCTTIVPELSGSEFFGHEKGAFTGASGLREGAFALANGGTLFLDEVGDLPPNLQAQLLRVIQEQAYKRVGGNEWKKTMFRLICATNRDLSSEVQNGRFRSDLYYRLAASCCRLPPLRERLEDVVPLCEYFIRQLCTLDAPPPMSAEVREYLLRREYPGNVRDLRQVISRILCRHLGPGPVTAGAIPEDERPAIPAPKNHWCDEAFEHVIQRAVNMGASLKAIGTAAEDVAVQIAMKAEEGNLRRAAQKLGVTDRALQMRRAAAREKAQLPGEQAS
jgi:transcriptional regulator with GAF, ATPase, and Fis domain